MYNLYVHAASRSVCIVVYIHILAVSDISDLGWITKIETNFVP